MLTAAAIFAAAALLGAVVWIQNREDAKTCERTKFKRKAR